MVDYISSPVAFFFCLTTPIIAVPSDRTWYLIESALALNEALGKDFSFSKAAILNKGISLGSKSYFPNSKVID
jgi:hypothetical protein